eukprot:1327495-Amorphochlora_amoeboformis.AAC.2
MMLVPPGIPGIQLLFTRKPRQNKKLPLWRPRAATRFAVGIQYMAYLRELVRLQRTVKRSEQKNKHVEREIEKFAAASRKSEHQSYYELPMRT